MAFAINTNWNQRVPVQKPPTCNMDARPWPQFYLQRSVIV
jgi:hypothetical protein